MPQLRRAVLEQTIRAIRRKKRVAVGARLMSFAACYVAGAVTVLLTYQSWSSPKPAELTAAPSVTFPEPLEQQAPHSLVSIDDMPEEQLSAPVLEKVAEYATRDQFRLLNRRAGDIYLAELKDPSAALRCYRRVLDSATLDELSISESDNWFIKALKEARLKEIQSEENKS